jgi:hypothetical protein
MVLEVLLAPAEDAESPPPPRRLAARKSPDKLIRLRDGDELWLLVLLYDRNS